MADTNNTDTNNTDTASCEWSYSYASDGSVDIVKFRLHGVPAGDWHEYTEQLEERASVDLPAAVASVVRSKGAFGSIVDGWAFIQD